MDERQQGRIAAIASEIDRLRNEVMMLAEATQVARASREYQRAVTLFAQIASLTDRIRDLQQERDLLRDHS